MWDLVPWPGIEPGSPALGVQSLTHGTSREVSLFKVLPFFLSSLEFMVHHFSYSFTEAQTTCLLTLCSCWPAGLHLEWPHPLAFPGLSLSSWTRVAGGESESQIAWYHCKSRFLGSQHCLGLFIHFSSPLFFPALQGLSDFSFLNLWLLSSFIQEKTAFLVHREKKKKLFMWNYLNFFIRSINSWMLNIDWILSFSSFVLYWRWVPSLFLVLPLGVPSLNAATPYPQKKSF